MIGADVVRQGSRKGDKFFEALKQYWGYEGFRPRQEEVVRSLAAGRDVCVVMPTGGGKSLATNCQRCWRREGRRW